MSPAALLEAGVTALGVTLSATQQTQLLAYVTLIGKWNKVYNLTAIRDLNEGVTHHILDSLTVLPHLSTVSRIADIGAGAGLPGIVLAIMRPELDVHTVDTVQKKVSFMRQAAIELGLKNLQAHHVRVEEWQPPVPIPALISRAFSELKHFVTLTDRVLEDGGRWFAMKGVYPAEELAQLPPHIRLLDAIPLRLPGAEAQRHLIVLGRQVS